MKKKLPSKLPPFLGLTVAQAAERLGWHMEAGDKENVPPHVCAVAWALSVLPLSPRERAEFLKASGMREKPTPQGMMLVAADKPEVVNQLCSSDGTVLAQQGGDGRWHDVPATLPEITSQEVNGVQRG